MPAFPRTPDIGHAPTHAGEGSRHYTQYKLRDQADREAARENVRRVAGNHSFVSKCLLIITRHGGSKQFITITGQDGLTWGIKDFISVSVHPLLSKLDAAWPGVIDAIFDNRADEVRDEQWLESHTIKRNDEGLVAIDWLRRGLDQIVCDRRFHGLQLHEFVREAVTPSREVFDEAGFGLAFSLAAMIGVANSFGARGMRRRLDTARDEAGSGAGEAEIIERFCAAYAKRDDDGHEADTRRLLRRGFGDESGPLPDPDDLGHSGRRIRELFLLFPWGDQEPFSELGDFDLDEEESYPPQNPP